MIGLHVMHTIAGAKAGLAVNGPTLATKGIADRIDSIARGTP